MCLWHFDRLGNLASCPFDIDLDGYQFIYAMLGYFIMPPKTPPRAGFLIQEFIKFHSILTCTELPIRYSIIHHHDREGGMGRVEGYR